MKQTSVKVVVVKDPEGNIWESPKGKSSWSGTSYAKNAWNCHNYKKHPKYAKLDINCKWSEDAEPYGWTTEVVAEYDLVKK